MAVEDKPAEGATPPAGKGKGSFVKKNKVAIIGIAGLGGVLLLSKKGGGSASTAGADQAAALEAARQGSVIPASVPAVSEGSGGGGSGASGPAPENTGANNPDLVKAIEAVGTGVQALAAADAAANAEKEGTKKDPAGAKPAVKKKPAPKKAEKSKPKKSTQKAGVTVHGRHFEGATGSHKGTVHKTTHGVSQTITVHYPGKTHTVTSHNNGQHWTDHTPGHTPPKRHVPTHSVGGAITGGTRAATKAAPKKPAPKPAPKKKKAVRA